MFVGLTACLQAANWRHLMAVSTTLGLKPHHRRAKHALIEMLSRSLTDRSTIKRVVEGLSPEADQALQSLVRAGGIVPIEDFALSFGVLRLYRPWWADSPRQPWRTPVSPTEELYYQGLIYLTSQETPQGRGEYVVIPQEILQRLPSPQPLPFTASLTPITPLSPLPTGTLLADVVLFLSLLHREDIRPVHQRWLPPKVMRTLAPRLSLKEDLAGARSELQTTHLRFLHYLCEAAGLVAPLGPYLKPTPQGWTWLEATADHELHTLWRAWLNPTPTTAHLWSRYHLPGAKSQDPLTLACITLNTLATVPPGRWFTVDSWVEATLALEPELERLTPWWKVQEGEDQAREGLRAMMEGPLAWWGAVGLAPSQEGEPSFCLTERGAWLLELRDSPPEGPEPSPLSVTHDLAVEIPFQASPLQLLRLEAFTEWLRTDRAQGRLVYRITELSLARALSRGESLEDLLTLLVEGGAELSKEQLQLLQGWAQGAGQPVIRHLTVLESEDAELLEPLLSQRALGRHIERTLSPQAAVVKEGQVGQLLRQLQRQGLHPRNLIPSEAQGWPPDQGETATYLWIAAQVYRTLGRFIPLPLRLPSALLEELEGNLSPSALAGAEATVQETISRLQDALDGWSAHPPPSAPGPVESILSLIEKALARREALEMVYWTEGRGRRTQRVVEPRRLEWRGEVPYLIAYCRLRQEERVFRVDRIEWASPYTT